MVVNSLNFLLFFVVVFVVYYLPINRKSHKFQNTWLFASSYFFYGFADWKMIPLLLGATIVFYGIGLWLKSEMEKGHVRSASNITTLGVVLGVGVLLYFKYLNFFADSFAQLLKAIGFNVSWSTLNIVLPIGVSFFTFKLISYVIEVHREHIQPSKNFVEFGTYVAFFPTIMSGPIDRPNTFLPQLVGVRFFKYDLAVDGCRQILWGVFTKMCIADNLAVMYDPLWRDIPSWSGSALLLAALLYPIQLYADFDGYSNMAIGVGKLLGFKIQKNFSHPFLARNVAEFWRKWHMSLTGWLTDYVFSPLNISFRNLGNIGIVFAIIINFVLVGLWHGANWTFALFGLYHGLLFVPLIFGGAFLKNKKVKSGKIGFPHLSDFYKMLVTYLLVTLGLIIFRASSIESAYNYMCFLFSNSVFNITFGYTELRSLGLRNVVLLLVLFLIILEWKCKNSNYVLEISDNSFFSRHHHIRLMLYLILILAVLTLKGEFTQFIYVQF